MNDIDTPMMTFLEGAHCLLFGHAVVQPLPEHKIPENARTCVTLLESSLLLLWPVVLQEARHHLEFDSVVVLFVFHQ